MNLLKLNTEMTMSSREIAKLTGKDHSNVMRDIRSMIAELEKQASKLKPAYKTSTYVSDENGQAYEQYELTHDMTMTLVTGYSASLRLAVVRRWQELELQQAKPNYTQAPQLPSPVYDAMLFASVVADKLSLPQSGFLDIAKRALTIKAPELVPALPSYGIDTSLAGLVTTSSSKPTFALSTLLKRHQLPYSAVGFNRLLVSAGVLIDMTRPSTTKGTKSYKAISPDWLHYGKNVVSPANPRETQPHYFEDTFMELVAKVTK